MTRTTYRPPATVSRSDYLKSGSDAFFRETIYTLVEAASQLLACREEFGRAIGLTPPQFTVMMGVALRQGDEGVTIKQIADHISLASTHVTTEVGRLVRKGLLIKQPNVLDGRSVMVRLSPAGEREIERVTPMVRAVNDLLFANIAPGALATANRVAKTLIEQADSALAELQKRR